LYQPEQISDDLSEPEAAQHAVKAMTYGGGYKRWL
jgi:hypothetical protein